MGGCCLLYLPWILLMRSGDIETNPGPNTSAVSEKEYLKLSQLIAASYYDNLGVNLEIPFVLLDDIRDHSNSNSVALMRVFMKWRDKQPLEANTRAVLAEKLQESGLDGLSDALLSDDLFSNMAPLGYQPELKEAKRPKRTQPSLPSESQSHQPLSPELIQRCADDFIFHYRSSLCKIRADPLDPDILVQFQDRYVDLFLEEEEPERDKHGQIKRRPLEYNDFLNLRVNGQFPRRLMVQGEAGAGKTTFCAKIAWDWIEGNYFQEFVWVLIVPLRDSEQYTIGEIAKSYLAYDNPATADQLTEYICLNKDKVYLVFDGLDELGGNAIPEGKDKSPPSDQQSELRDQSSQSSDPTQLECKEQCNSVSSDDEGIKVIDIIHSRKLEACPILVTARPWKAKEIRQNGKLKRLYKFLYVEGFSAENLALYILKYFPSNEAKANDLIQFVGDNDVISESMVHYPVYISILCFMWKGADDEKQEIMKSLQTFSQIFIEIFGFLKEHFALKIAEQSCSLDEPLDDHLKAINKHLEPIASLALTGLLDNRLVFKVDDLKHCPKSMETACRVGVLSQENRIMSKKKGHGASQRQRISTVFFPHKLFQEFMAGMHLASLYETDNEEYNRWMTEVVVPRKEEFRYLLYFTSSESQVVGIDVMTHLSDPSLRKFRNKNDVDEGRDFLADVAFECHDKHAATLVKDKLLPENATLRIYDMTTHTVAGYAFVGLEMVRLMVLQDLGPTMSHDVAEMICSSPSLRVVYLRGTLHANFYNILAARGRFSAVQSLTLRDCEVSAPASVDFAAALCSIPHLTKLSMDSMPLNDVFCSTLREMASSMQVQSLTLRRVQVSAPAFADLAAGLGSLPHLTNLLMGTSLDDEFYSTLRTMSSSMKGCFPQISKGNFKFNGESYGSLESLISQLSSSQWSVILSLYRIAVSVSGHTRIRCP